MFQPTFFRVVLTSQGCQRLPKWLMVPRSHGTNWTNYHIHRIHVWYIYANIGGILMVNVTIYSIHGSYGIWRLLIWDGPHHRALEHLELDGLAFPAIWASNGRILWLLWDWLRLDTFFWSWILNLKFSAGWGSNINHINQVEIHTIHPYPSPTFLAQVLPHLNHSNFCPGFDVAGDLRAEVTS